MQILSDQEDLMDLMLNETQISDSGLVHLHSLTKLETFDLNNTKISDNGLASIKFLTNLKHLNLEGTNVTKAGLEKLRKSLPECTIDIMAPDGTVETWHLSRRNKPIYGCAS